MNFRPLKVAVSFWKDSAIAGWGPRTVLWSIARKRRGIALIDIAAELLSEKNLFVRVRGIISYFIMNQLYPGIKKQKREREVFLEGREKIEPYFAKFFRIEV